MKMYKRILATINYNFTVAKVSTLLFGLLLTACAAMGTKTIYRSDDISTKTFSLIGYSQIANEELLNRIIPNTSDLYQKALNKYFSDKTTKIQERRLTTLTSIENIDTLEIKRICAENNLDGFLCTKIKYLFVDNSVMYIPLGQSEDAFVEMKIFDRNGRLLVHTKHNTKDGNSYMMPPKAHQTIEDGTFGALKRIFKEIG